MITRFYSSRTPLPAILEIPKACGPVPGIVFPNGLCAYKEMYNDMAAAFNAAGYATLQYDPRGSEGPDKGRFLCGTEWLDDLNAAICFLMAQPGVDKTRVALCGVSMGGGLVIMQGAADPRIKCVYAMAPCPGSRRLNREQWIQNRGEAAWEGFLKDLQVDGERVALGEASEYRDSGVLFAGTATDPALRAEELRLHPGKAGDMPMEASLNCILYYDPMTAVQHLEIPLLLVHGTGDETIPCHWSQDLFDAAHCEKALHFIEGAPHVLPEADCLDEVIRYGLDWFRRYL